MKSIWRYYFDITWSLVNFENKRANANLLLYIYELDYTLLVTCKKIQLVLYFKITLVNFKGYCKMKTICDYLLHYYHYVLWIRTISSIIIGCNASSLIVIRLRVEETILWKYINLEINLSCMQTYERQD